MQVAGLDVWRKGWVAVFVTDGGLERVVAYSRLETFAADADGLDVVGIDIPLLLPSVPPRRADIEARRLVGPRRSSVFNAPPLDVLEQPTYRQAREVSQDRYGVGLSAQSYALRTRILETRQFALADGRFVEVHPEASFAAMAGAPLPFAKKTWNGQQVRRELLRREGLTFPSTLGGDAGLVAVDDVLDAAAASWSALRKARGAATRVPADPSAGEGAIWI